MTDYYTINEMYGEKFYQVPKVFFTNPLYKKGLNDREKLAFGMLKDRFSLSVKNKWYDDQGRIYFIFTVENLMEILDCSNKTVSNIKKNLEAVGLLEIKKRGQGKADLLYLKKPIVTDNDIYEIDKAETVGAVETCKSYTSKNVKVTPQEVKKLHSNDTDSSNTNINETDMLSIVNKESLEPRKKHQKDTETKQELTDLCNELYAEFAPGRWNKKEWLALIDRFVSGLIKNGMHFAVHRNRWKSYVYNAIKKIAYNHDKKQGLIEALAASPTFNEKHRRDTSFYYDWLTDNEQS